MQVKNLKNHIRIMSILKANKETVQQAFVSEELATKNNLADSFDLSIVYLLQLQVTKLSVFSATLWDYNLDVINPPRNTQGAKLKINFNKYQSIPKFVLIELKCLLHYVILTPSVFKKNKPGKVIKKSIAPNTAIAQFEAGFRYLNCLYESLQEYGKEYVDENFNSLNTLLSNDFKGVIEGYRFAITNSLIQFFRYLTHPNTLNKLGIEVDLDLAFLEEALKEEQKNKDPKKANEKMFSNKNTDLLITHSSNRVIQFLQWQREDIIDQRSLSAYQEFHLNSLCQQVIITPELLNNYTIKRLLNAGYEQSYIEMYCNIPIEYLNTDGSLCCLKKLSDLMKTKHGITNFDDLRMQIREVYHAATFILAFYMGARPNVLSNTRLSAYPVEHEGIKLLVSNENKNKFENLNLFDDKWVVTPIMEDALAVIAKISVLKNNDFIFSNMETVSPGKQAQSMASGGISHFFKVYLEQVLGQDIKDIAFNPYFFRHTLAYQLNRIAVGLPFISFQLKHLVNNVEKYKSSGASTDTTIDYGGIAEGLLSNHTQNERYRKLAELDKVQSLNDPDGVYVGEKGKAHKQALIKLFTGYMAAGYSKEEIFEAMVEQGTAVINVGTGFCGGGVESYDESLPCIGTLRCNPRRCKNAVITKVHIPAWKEVYLSNKKLLRDDNYADRKDQIQSIIEEATTVLTDLGVELE